MCWGPLTQLPYHLHQHRTSADCVHNQRPLVPLQQLLWFLCSLPHLRLRIWQLARRCNIFSVAAAPAPLPLGAKSHMLYVVVMSLDSLQCLCHIRLLTQSLSGCFCFLGQVLA